MGRSSDTGRSAGLSLLSRPVGCGIGGGRRRRDLRSRWHGAGTGSATFLSTACRTVQRAWRGGTERTHLCARGEAYDVLRRFQPPDAARRGHNRSLPLRISRFFARVAALRHRRRRQGAAAPPERSATVPHRTAMTALCRVGGALAALLSTVTVGAAAPHDAAFVAWAKAHAVQIGRAHV